MTSSVLDFQQRIADVYFDVLAEIREVESALDYNYATAPGEDYEQEQKYSEALHNLKEAIKTALGDSVQEQLMEAIKRRGLDKEPPTDPSGAVWFVVPDGKP